MRLGIYRSVARNPLQYDICMPHLTGTTIRQQIQIGKHLAAKDQQRAQEVLPPAVLRVAQLRMVRGSAEDPADLDLPTPGCAAARSRRGAAL